MRNKTLGINVRVTPDEKEKLCQNAKYCGLSLSEYLRKTGLCKELETAFRNLTQCYRFLSHPPPSFYAITL